MITVNETPVYITVNETPVRITVSPANGRDGRSAYEVAVANGFDGTEAEWLNTTQLPIASGQGLMLVSNPEPKWVIRPLGIMVIDFNFLVYDGVVDLRDFDVFHNIQNVAYWSVDYTHGDALFYLRLYDEDSGELFITRVKAASPASVRPGVMNEFDDPYFTAEIDSGVKVKIELNNLLNYEGRVQLIILYEL